MGDSAWPVITTEKDHESEKVIFSINSSWLIIGFIRSVNIVVNVVASFDCSLFVVPKK